VRREEKAVTAPDPHKPSSSGCLCEVLPRPLPSLKSESLLLQLYTGRGRCYFTVLKPAFCFGGVLSFQSICWGSANPG
jgi:hypothetical protein